MVEDTPSSLKLLAGLLATAGHRVRQAPNGELALWTAGAHPPDLVLLDIRMPGMDGFEVCRRLKAIPGLGEVPVIFLSASTDTDDKVKGFEAGGVDYISKPYQFEEVNARVKTHLKIRRLQQRLAYQNENLAQLVEAKASELAQTKVSLMAERELRDIAERESAQRLAEIAHMNRNASASVYSAALIHELNQPLAAILSNAEAAELLLRQAPPALGEVAEILADIRRDDLRARDLILRMRELLRKSDPRTEAIDLNALLDTVATLLGSEARMRQVRLETRPSAAPLLVAGDRIQLQQVLVNLVLNAIEALGAAGSGARLVSLECLPGPAGEAEVRVRDSGPGFPDLGRVFESFFTTKPQGMGLGLPICASIIAAHGGRIWAENPGSGALVAFRLPLYEEETV
ncbi:response regulator [Massilia sp. TS11]|uniref:sensor histidine kinase n=1 Tax=Massilia sp. TS11 TaxID=2908003 RepID=UPI001EDC01F4|nr:response regulator [Massilia sp. TS11]